MRKAQSSEPKVNPNSSTLITPRNDGESAAIIDIAKRFSMDVRISAQPWGATLDKEPRETWRDLKRNVIVVEIPGPEIEEELKRNHSLYIVDHHNYPGLDRRNALSSIEQFADLIGYKLNRFEMGVAINDRSFIDGLMERGYSEDEIEIVRRYDLDAQGYMPEDFDALEKAYNTGRSEGPLYIVETQLRKTSYLSDIHIRRNPDRELRPGLVVIKLDGKGNCTKVSVGGKPALVKRLSESLGGFSGGDEAYSMYWGKEIDGEVSAREIADEIIKCTKK